MLAYGQQKTITVGDVPAAVTTKAFVNTPVVQFRKGEVRPANFVIGNGSESLWDVRAHEFVINGHSVRFPVLGIINCSGSTAGADCSVVASMTNMKVDLRVGEEAHYDGYVLEAARTVKAGETVPTLLIISKKGQSVISIEAAPDAKSKGEAAKPQPWLTIFDERLKQSDRTLTLGAWRDANETVASMLVVPGMLTPDR